MIRTLIQFDEETHRKLRHKAFQQERSVSALVRELVAHGLEPGIERHHGKRRPQFVSVAAGRSKAGRPSSVSERHDEALIATFKK